MTSPAATSNVPQAATPKIGLMMSDENTVHVNARIWEIGRVLFFCAVGVFCAGLMLLFETIFIQNGRGCDDGGSSIFYRISVTTTLAGLAMIPVSGIILDIIWVVLICFSRCIPRVDKVVVASIFPATFPFLWACSARSVLVTYGYARGLNWFEIYGTVEPLNWLSIGRCIGFGTAVVLTLILSLTIAERRGIVEITDRDLKKTGRE
jgi:hypothetical protein